MTKLNLTKTIQEFHDGAYEDEKLQDLIHQLTVEEELTGVRNPVLLERIFDYLDLKLQNEIRSLKQQ